MSTKCKYPQWFDGHKVNEILFCQEFRKAHPKHVLDNHRGFHNILVLIDPNKPGALDGAFFEEQQSHAPYTPFLP